MRRAQFPARGSVVTLPLAVVPTEPAEGETTAAFTERRDLCASLAGIELDVVMCTRTDLVSLGHRFALWGAAEERRRREIEAKGDPVPGLTLEGSQALRALQVEVVVSQVQMIRGLTVGAVDSESLTGDALAMLVDDAGLLADVARVARAAQSPTPQQMER